jgi:hypothetical protein
MACGGGIMDCGAFGACGQFADICDQSGVENRACTDSTCQSGECVTSDPYVDSRTCSRNTEGTTCAVSTSSCGFCAYSSTCDNTAPDVSCSRTDHTCTNETCTSNTVSLPNRSCDRDHRVPVLHHDSRRPAGQLLGQRHLRRTVSVS